MMPPRHGKSELATINFPAWYLGNFPSKEIITVSYSEDLAVIFGGKTRNLVQSPAYNSIFPDVRLLKDERSKARWTTGFKGSYTSVGVGGSLTGRGADFLIIDDPLKNRKDADSELMRQNQWEWFSSTAYTRLEPNGTVILILTRWHLDDLAGRILTNPELRKKTKVISFPAIAIQDEKFRKSGEALWPIRYPLEELESKRSALGVYDWNSLYQQSPILSANQEFKKPWIRTRLKADIDNKNTRKFLTVDTAVSKRDSADSTGFCDNAVDEDDNWNIRAWRMKLNPKELIDALFLLYERRGYEKIGIEKTIYLQAIAPFLLDEMNKRKAYLPIYELDHKQTNKETRIRGLIPRYGNGKIYHVEGECSDLEEELFTFPFGAHDDVVDAVAYQLQLAEPGSSLNGIASVVAPHTKTQEHIHEAI